MMLLKISPAPCPLSPGNRNPRHTSPVQLQILEEEPRPAVLTNQTRTWTESGTRTPPNIRPPPTAPTLAALPAPTPPTAASSPWTAWTLIPEAPSEGGGLNELIRLRSLDFTLMILLWRGKTSYAAFILVDLPAGKLCPWFLTPPLLTATVCCDLYSD